MEWRFDSITRQTTKVNPEHLEFFRSEALEDAVSALVREDIQNRLDAKSKRTKEPVKVRYYVSGRASRIEPPDSAKWLKGLEAHLNAPKSLEELGSGPVNLARPMPYLVMEDFNTTGLQGDPLQTSDPEDNADRNDFYWFVRNVGRTGKKAGDRGRWGLGKIVYPAASSIRSFFCYSIREGDLRRAFIGRSVLAIHSVNGQEYQSEGYYGNFPDLNYPYYAVPEESAAFIGPFAKLFNVRRQPTEPGISLVIPFPDDSISLNTLVEKVIHHYFWEILRGSLEVEIEDDRKKFIISREGIDDIVSSWPGFNEADRKVIQHRLEFCRKADGMQLTDPDGFYLLSKPSSYGSVRLGDLFQSPDILEKAKQRFRNGDIVAAEFVVGFRKKGDVEERDTSFLVFLQRDNDLDRPDETFIRDGLTIIGEGRIREPGIRALVLAEDPTIAEFLGDAENPAHTKWLSTTKHFRGKYSPGSVLLEYIKSSGLRLANLLGKVENEMLDNLLDNLFGVPYEEHGRPPEPKSTGKRGGKKPPKGGAERRRYLQTSKLASEAGFVVRLSPDAKKCPDRVTIRMAYESESGNPFDLFHPADFDLTAPGGQVQVSVTSCSVKGTEPNRLEVEPLGNDFEIKLTGFDRNRDLRLDVRPQMTTAVAEGEG
jgi:hypothetical protein